MVSILKFLQSIAYYIFQEYDNVLLDLNKVIQLEPSEPQVYFQFQENDTDRKDDIF
uniref:Uncharacterized protein n=1 Tax=Rhizophagus irregularis (strain DAOM 181602 / DAOM 197198 / MUCL 43194) TaxID=747089 RepID=U9TT34_RHIID